jgi:hypothetical protein
VLSRQNPYGFGGFGFGFALHCTAILGHTLVLGIPLLTADSVILLVVALYDCWFGTIEYLPLGLYFVVVLQPTPTALWLLNRFSRSRFNKCIQQIVPPLASCHHASLAPGTWLWATSVQRWASPDNSMFTWQWNMAVGHFPVPGLSTVDRARLFPFTSHYNCV